MNNIISIIIVNFNGKKWLKKCFDSILKQTYKNFEIILVDNASTDSSIEYIKSSFKDSRIKIIKSKKNLGFAGGNNLGINNSKGDYILFLNNDTWINKKFLDKIYSYYKKNKFDLVAPYEKDYKNEKKFFSYNNTIDLFGHPILRQNQKPSFYLSGVCLFFSKKIYFETQGLDDNFFMYFEEIDWFWRLNLLNKKFSFVKDLYIYHYGAGSTSTGNKIKYLSFLWRNQNTLQMLLKNYSWFNLLWVTPIYFIQNIIEITFFLIILKPKVSYSYIEGWIFNIKNIKSILRERKWVQKNRLISDFKIMKKMNVGFSKLQHLFLFLKYLNKKATFKSIVPGLVSLDCDIKEFRTSDFLNNLNFFDEVDKKERFHYKLSINNQINFPQDYDFKSVYFFKKDNFWYYKRKIFGLNLEFKYDVFNKSFECNNLQAIIPFRIGGLLPITEYLQGMINLNLFLEGFNSFRGCAFYYHDKNYCFIAPGLNGKTTLLSNIISKGGKYIAEDYLLINFVNMEVYPTLNAKMAKIFNRRTNEVLEKKLHHNNIMVKRQKIDKLILVQNFTSGNHSAKKKKLIEFTMLNSLFFPDSLFIKSYLFEENLIDIFLERLTDIEEIRNYKFAHIKNYEFKDLLE